MKLQLSVRLPLGRTCPYSSVTENVAVLGLTPVPALLLSVIVPVTVTGISFLFGGQSILGEAATVITGGVVSTTGAGTIAKSANIT